MPIRLPELDNRTFDDLLKEMLAAIPRFSKEWTNFNPSDPGIAVIELLAWISEGLIYRANRIPEASYLNFLKLAAGTRIYDDSDQAHKEIHDFVEAITDGTERPDPQAMKAAAQKFLQSRYRAVTAEDFRALAHEASPAVRRVEVLPAKDVIVVAIVPDAKEAKQNPDLIRETVQKVQVYLDQRRLLGTIINVRPADYTDIGLKIEITCEPYASSDNFGKTVRYVLSGNNNATSYQEIHPDKVEGAVARAIVSYLDSITGGAGGKGWPYARAVMVYELFNIIEKIDSVRYVGRITQFLFGMETSYKDNLPTGQQEDVQEAIRDKFLQSGYLLPQEATASRSDDGWIISDRDKKDLYSVHPSGEGLNVYRPFTEIKVIGLINLTSLEIKIEAIGDE